MTDLERLQAGLPLEDDQKQTPSVPTNESAVNSDDLAQIRAMAKSALNKANQPQVEAEEPEEELVEDEEEAVVFIGDDDAEEEVQTETATLSTPPSLEDMVKAYDRIPNEEARMMMATALHKDIDQYQKDLIIKNGLTPEEASQAAWNRMNNLSSERTAKYLEDNPEIAVVKIDKAREDDLQFTEEEKAKLEKVKAIQLVVVEDKEIASLISDPIPSDERISFLDDVLGSLSKYGLPMPNYGDFVSFRGAKFIQLASVVFDENTKPSELANAQASLVYDRLIGGTHLKKTDSNGNPGMTYENFINNFPYHDLQMAMYAILCASREEDASFDLTCKSCGKTTKVQTNAKSLLQLGDDYVNEYFKSRIDAIMKAKNDDDEMSKLVAEWNKSISVKSMNGKFIYTIQQPSVAKAIKCMAIGERKNNGSDIYSVIMSWLRAIYVRDDETGKYIVLRDTDKELDRLMAFAFELPDAELASIRNFIAERSFQPTMAVKYTCSCGANPVYPLEPYDLLFQTILDLQEAIV